MSYCFSDEAHVWISALNWERAVGRVASATGSSVAQTAGAIRSRIATASAGGPNLGVSAEIGAGAGHILRVEPGRGRVNAPAPGSDVSFRVRDKSGQVVSDTPVVVQPTHIDLVNHGTSLVEVSAVVPAAGAASIELVKSGIVLDTVRRSASAPSVKLLKPRSGLHVGSGGSLQARWRAKDRDRDPLLSSVEFSADGGKHWKAIVVGQPGGRYRVPVSYLSHTDNARLRVSISDGWNEASAVSGRFSVEGPPPQATIESPPNRTRLRAGDPLNLDGAGFDDLSRTLSGRRLQWFDGRHSLGHGPHLSVLAIEPGQAHRATRRDRSPRPLRPGQRPRHGDLGKASVPRPRSAEVGLPQGPEGDDPRRGVPLRQPDRRRSELPDRPAHAEVPPAGQARARTASPQPRTARRREEDRGEAEHPPALRAAAGSVGSLPSLYPMLTGGQSG